MIARDESTGLATVRTVTSFTLSPRCSVSRRSSPGSCRPTSRRSCAGVLTGTPSTATITSSGFSSFAAGTSAETLVTRTPRGVATTSIAKGAERDDRRDLLRAVHVGRVLSVTFRVGGSVRGDSPLGNHSRAVRPRERQQLLEPANPSDEEVDVVDVALGVRLATLHLDAICKRLGAVRDEEEVVRRRPPEHERGGQPEQAEDDRSAGESLQLLEAPRETRRRRASRCRSRTTRARSTGTRRRRRSRAWCRVGAAGWPPGRPRSARPGTPHGSDPCRCSRARGSSP